MSRTATPRRRWTAAVAVLATTFATGLATVAGALPAQAAISPPQGRPAGVATADALPTVQINGIVWSQAIVGNNVYAGGRYTQARPAGAAPGVNQTPRNNLLSYDIRTGVLNTTFNPNLNGQVLSVAKSPNGSRVFVGGDFSQANGQARSRLASYNTQTGQLTNFSAPSIAGQVRAVVVTNSVVYVGGSFQSVGNQTRRNLAAFDANTGALLNWAPEASAPVWAITVNQNASTVIAGGQFTHVNGTPADGLAWVDAATGNLNPKDTPINRSVDDAGITSLTVDGEWLYGSKYAYLQNGKSEGIFKISAETGGVDWVNDCHGDTYGVWPGANAVYFVGHPHYCGNVSLGMPQYQDWYHQHSMAVSKEATGVNIREVHGYKDWAGTPSPSTYQWFPTMSTGTFSGSAQAGWHVTGTDEYVVIGGEFPRVNGTGQQGLVRFAAEPIAPGNRGPAVVGNNLIPTLEPYAPGAVKISWLAGYDQDDRSLNYQVVRSPGGVVANFNADSSYFHTPGLSIVDTGLTPGQSYSYQVRITDGSGNRVFGANRSVQAPQTVERNAYASAVIGDGAKLYWPLNDATGSTTVTDSAAGYHGVPGSAVTFGVEGAITGDTAVSVANSNNGRIYAQGSDVAPNEFSVEAWFRTTATSGRLIGFGDLQVGNSGHRDRQIYLTNEGRVHFGIQSDGPQVIASPNPANDGAWHHVVGTLSGDTARLYLDGVLVGEMSGITNPEQYIGHWRAGGDRQSGWPSAGSSNWNGGIDEVAVYPHALNAAQIAQHFNAATGSTANIPPVAQFTSTVDVLKVSVDASASGDADGTIAEYRWEFGDGATATGVTASHTYAAAGQFTVKLVVTDDDGATSEKSAAVTVADAPPANQAPNAQFSESVDELKVSVDASASGDADGTIAEYRWEFGDGATATGVTASHTYAAAGQFTIKLVVTDDDGATDEATKNVTVTAPPAPQVVVQDAFDRTATNGFGAAETGGSWTTTNTRSLFSVSEGWANVRVPNAGAGPAIYLGSADAGSVEASVDLRADKVGTGGGIYNSLIVRRNGTSDYRLRVRIQPTTVQVLLTRLVNGAETNLAYQTLPIAYQAGDVLKVKFQASGMGTTQLAGKVWVAGTAEPDSWLLQATDSTAALQNAGGVGLMSYLSSSASNSPVVVSWDNLRVVPLG